MQIASGKTNCLDGFGIEALTAALNDWTFWARTDQLPPTTTDWTTWLVLGGRGAGKTRTGAEWIVQQVRDGARQVALVGETYEDAREVMIAGPSGVCSIGRDEERPVYESSRHRLRWPNGAVGHIFSAGDPDGLRGFQFECAWSDEVAKWRLPEEAWSNLQLGLRLGDRPRQVVTTTPRPIALLKTLMDRPTTAITRATTYANRGHLAPTFLSEIASVYEGTALGRQELLGEVIEDRAGALWNWSMVENARVDTAPELDRIIVAIDPPVTAGPDSDECGILVAGVRGVGADAMGYVLQDASAPGLSPSDWARTGVSLFHQYKADRIIAEVNQGGDMVEQMVRMADANVPFRAVRATRSKTLRAEPVAALYEKGRVRHVGSFPALEEQLTSYTGAPGEKSPDRLDALVWAISDLMFSMTADPTVRRL